MAQLRVECPACDVKLKLTNPALVGKTITCPKCKERFVVPATDDEEPSVEDTFEEERPEKVTPRKKKKKKNAKTKKPSLLPYLIGGGALLAAIVVILIFALGGSDDKKNANLAKGKEMTGNSTGEAKTDVGKQSGLKKDKEITGNTSNGTQPASTTAPPQFTYDVAKLGYDPNKPDMTIAARDWPRRSSIDDQSLLAYNGKVIASEGRIRAIWGGDRNAIIASLYLFDVDGPTVDNVGRTVPVRVSLSDQVHWKRLRPGQIVKVVGEGKTASGAPSSLQISNSVILTVSGEGDKPMSPKDVVEAYASEPTKYKSGSVTDQYITLVGAIYRVPNVKPEFLPLLLVGEPGSLVMVQIDNAKDFAENHPKVVDTVTIVARVTETDYLYDLGNEPKPKALGMSGLLITK